MYEWGILALGLSLGIIISQVRVLLLLRSKAKTQEGYILSIVQDLENGRYATSRLEKDFFEKAKDDKVLFNSSETALGELTRERDPLLLRISKLEDHAARHGHLEGKHTCVWRLTSVESTAGFKRDIFVCQHCEDKEVRERAL